MNKRFGFIMRRFLLPTGLLAFFMVFIGAWIFLYFEFMNILQGSTTTHLANKETLFLLVGGLSLGMIIFLVYLFSQLHAKQRELDEMHEQFTNTLVHDLRNPLHVIKGYAELASNEQNREKSIEVITQTSNQLIGMIGNILDIKKTQSQHTANASVQNMVPVISSVIDSFAPLAEEKEMSVSFIPHSSMCLAVFNTQSLRRICNNIIGNAIEHSRVRDTITVSIHDWPVDPSLYLLSIKDTGPGIPQGSQDSIFKPFYQAGNTDTSTAGSGLGLTSAKMLVEDMGGTIWFTSSSAGTVFSFTIPKPQK